MIGPQFIGAAMREAGKGQPAVIQLPDAAVCRIEQFVDREVQISRCITPGHCPHRRAYLGNRICGYPNIKAELAGTAAS